MKFGYFRVDGEWEALKGVEYHYDCVMCGRSVYRAEVDVEHVLCKVCAKEKAASEAA